MKTKLGLTILAAACMGLAGCLNGADQNAETRQQQANSLKFIQESSAPLTAKIGSGIDTSASVDPNEIVAKNIEKLGCPKLAALFSDFSKYTGQGEFPKSFTEYLSCFGLSTNPTQEQLDGVTEKFQNPTELLDCICGGTALSQLLAGKFEVFSVQASAAAQVFNVSNSKAADNYDASQSKAADNYSSN